MVRLAAIVLGCTAAASVSLAVDQVSAQSIAPRVYTPVPTGKVTPKGWLLKQLRLQAEGLSGHLSMFWEDIKDSVWVGGSGDGSLHERTPYWLNGVVPLSYLLKNADGQHILPGVRGIYKAADGFGHGHDTPRAAGVSASGAIDATDSSCQNNTDMKYNDICNQPASSQAECFAQCNTQIGAVGWVWDACDKHCWCKNANGVTSNATCRCYGTMPPVPIPAVNMSAQVETYLDYIISHQLPSGWLGPAEEEASQDGSKWWGRSNVLLAMAMYAEAEPARFEEVTSVMLKYMLVMESQLSASKPALSSWASQRWMDLCLSTQWMLLNGNISDADRTTLWNLANLLHEQGEDWETWFHTFGPTDAMHNVNLAQALKSAAIWYGMTGNETLRSLSLERMQRVDHEWGLPTGMFNGDEITPAPHTRNPSRGIELCGVVEAMFSYNTMFSVFGDVAFADRAERIAYNALPATWASPTGGDMWAHQYLQAVNEINAIKADPHVWTHDGDEAETYGLEPNFGCCTANFNQGWPKFAGMAVYTTNDTGVAVGVYAPVTVDVGHGRTVDIDTSYPFADVITVTVSGNITSTPNPMPVYLRVPGWASGPGRTINGKPLTAPNGTMLEMSCASSPCSFELNFNPQIRVEEWGDFATNGSRVQAGPYSLHRGALMYSLPLGLNFTQTQHHFGPPNDSSQSSNDYEVRATAEQPWNVAMDIDDTANPEASLTFHQGTYGEGAAAFNHSRWPCNLTGSVRVVPSWGEKDNSASAPPASPACTAKGSNCGASTNVVFVPYGGTDLRISELPLSGIPSSANKD